MPAMDTTRDRVEAEVGLSLLSLAPHIDSSFVIYPARKRRPSSRLDSISSPPRRGGRAPADFIRQLGN